jgi:hypothetical protein
MSSKEALRLDLLYGMEAAIKIRQIARVRVFLAAERVTLYARY